MIPGVDRARHLDTFRHPHPFRHPSESWGLVVGAMDACRVAMTACAGMTSGAGEDRP